MEEVAVPAPAAGAPSRGTSRHFWSSAGTVFVGNVIARALGFAFPLLLAHLTSRTEFALVYFFVSTGFFAGELVLAGFPTAVTRRLAAEQTDPSRGRWLLAGLGGGLPLLILSLAGGEFLALLAGAPPLLMSLVVLGLTIDAFYFASLRGLEAFKLLMGYRIGANAVQLVLLAVAAAAGALNVPLAVAIYGFSYLVPIAAIELRGGPVHQLLASRERPGRCELRDLTGFAIPALISGTAYGVVLGLDVFFVGLLAPVSLPDYGAARALAMPVLMVPFAVGIVLMPRAAGSNPIERLALLKSALLLVAGLGAVIALAYLWLGELAITALLPASYQPAYEPLRVLAPALVMLGIYSVLSQWWFALGRPLVPALALSLGAAVSAGMHAIMTAQHGAVGAGLAIAGGAASALAVLALRTFGEAHRVQPGRTSE